MRIHDEWIGERFMARAFEPAHPRAERWIEERARRAFNDSDGPLADYEGSIDDPFANAAELSIRRTKR